jgi:hypothetical protein
MSKITDPYSIPLEFRTGDRPSSYETDFMWVKLTGVSGDKYKTLSHLYNRWYFTSPKSPVGKYFNSIGNYVSDSGDFVEHDGLVLVERVVYKQDRENTTIDLRGVTKVILVRD